MIIDRENLILIWAGGGPDGDKDFVLEVGEVLCPRVPFPNVTMLSPTERYLLRPALMAHPEWLLSYIHCDRGIQ